MGLIADRVKETSTTTGTGTYSLAGAETGFQGFVAGIGDGLACYYCATDDTDWEIGLGTVSDLATDTLSRDTILASSNGDAAVDWAAGTRTIFVTIPASQAGGAGRPQESKTASWTLSTPGYYDNEGATVTVIATFTNSPKLEAVLARVDDYEVQIKPPSGKYIIRAGVKLAVDEVLVIASGYGSIWCIVNPNGHVQVFAEVGDIQEGSP